MFTSILAIFMNLYIIAKNENTLVYKKKNNNDNIVITNAEYLQLRFEKLRKQRKNG